MFGWDKIKVIVLDTETNGLTPKDSVLAITTLSIDLFVKDRGNSFEIFTHDMSERYYHLRENEPQNPHALNVHQLTPDRINQLRDKTGQNGTGQNGTDNRTYDENVIDDMKNQLMIYDFIVGHNLAFDLRMLHVEEFIKEQGIKTFCTMRQPHDLYKELAEEPFRGSASLARAAALLNVDYNKEGKHDATVDTFVTAKVFQQLLDYDKTWEHLTIR